MALKICYPAEAGLAGRICSPTRVRSTFERSPITFRSTHRHSPSTRVHIIGTLESTRPGTASVGAETSRAVGSLVCAGNDAPKAPQIEMISRDERPERKSGFLSLDVALAGRCARRRLTRTCTATAARRRRRAYARAVILHGASWTSDPLGRIRGDGPVFGAFS